MSGFPLSLPVRVAEVPARGLRRRWPLEPAELTALAAYLGIEGAARLEADFLLTRRGGDGLHLALGYEGVFVRRCVVSLEEFESPVAGRAERLFVAGAPSAPSADIDPEAELEAEPLDGGLVDLGAVLCEELALALDPYPRKPGARLEAAPEDGAEGPFAVLKELKP
ncbi:MAG: DUF177 domain-containing protein [Alphaproteobacteria bacterium]|nr:DUF177 domain-containing protein [Alphaproteobacteria bacterium]